MGIKKRNIEGFRSALREFKERRAKFNEEKVEIPKSQAELLPLLRELDPEGVGIVVDEADQKTGVAFYQQNDPSESWDVESIMQYLKGRKGVYMAVTSRVFDPMKWEAEIANGNISKKVANRMRVTNNPPSPFIRFGMTKKGTESL